MGSRSRRASCRSGIGCNRTIIIANQDKNNYECPGKPLDFLAVFYLKKTDFRTVCNYFFPHIVSPGLPSRRSACWAIPTYAGFGATLPLIGQPTPRSEPRAGAPGRPFTTPSPPCALIPGSGPIRSAGRLPPRPSTRRLGGLRPMRGVFQMPRGLNARFRAREAAFKERFSARKPSENRRFFHGETAWKFSGFSRPFAIIVVRLH